MPKSLTGVARHPVPICAVGASAGGLAALRELFGGLRADLGMAYVVIVHLAPDHPSQLDEILSQSTSMPVRQVTDTPRLEPDCIYVIPPDRELVIAGDDVHAREFTEPRGRRAPIDLFFRSVAAGRGDGMAVILSGAGSDGAVGVRRIKEGGGVVFVQDPGDAEYPMMPRSAIATGVADFVVPVHEMAERIAEVSRSKEAIRAVAEDEAEATLARITGHLHARTGHDFSHYKRATVMRRVARRMQVTRRPSLGAYETYLRETPEEAQELFSDLLIVVTMFFRDRNAFEALREGAIGSMLDAADPAAGVRAWVAGCATGEEAYSLAIVMLEEAERRGRAVPIQIFATDLDEGALATAREGRYPKAIEADVTEERLRRFFVEEGAHWRIRQEVRDAVLFAHHSAVKDPPFMRLDLISCRNLLIYLDRELQRQMLALFHYALKPGGHLFLGSAETVDMRPDLFAPVDREARVYAARAQAAGGAALVMQMPVEHRPHMPSPRPRRRPEEAAGAAEVHAASLEAAAPPSALVDAERRVLHLSETAGRFIAPSRGALPDELAALVRPELRAELSGALHRAFSHGEPTLTLPAAVAFEGGARRVIMQVAPVPAGPHGAPRALVCFLDGGTAAPGGEEDENEETAPAEVRRLREELRTAHDRLSASRREHEDATQELRVANEELQSINEEYRSTSEELETSKEELQSINEELQTVNAELKSKLDSIASAHSDLENLVAATEIGTLFLDPRLRIKMFTPVVAQVFNITEADIGRAITDFTHHLAYDGIEEDARRVLRELSPFESEVKTRDGRWMMMRVRPYRTLDDRIDGVVVSFVDVSERVTAEARLRESEERYATLFETMDEGFLIAEVVRDEAGEAVDLRYLNANPAALRLTGIDLEGRRLTELGPGFEAHWWREPARVAATRVSERHELQAAPLGKWFEVLLTPIDGDQVAILFQDTTERRREEEALRRTRDLLAMATDTARLGWWTWDLDTGAMDWDARGREIAGLPPEGEVTADDTLRLIPAEDRTRVEDHIARCIERGEPLDVEYRVAHPDGSPHHVHGTGTFRREEDGPLLGTGLVRDITRMKRAEAESELLIGELNHRVKNMLTVVQSVARQTQRSAGSVAAYAEAFERRLHALAAAYGLLTQSRWTGSALGELAQAALGSFAPDGQGRLLLDGPQVPLSPSATLSFAMALHELGTNAVKHGALSAPEGAVEVDWRLVAPHEDGAGGAGTLHLEWRERGGPRVAPPTHRGFGSRLLEYGVARELDGTVTLDYREDGLRCVMDLPLGDGIGP